MCCACSRVCNKMADRESRKRKQRDYKAHTWRIYLNKPGYKVCFGKKKMAARRKEISRKTTVVSRPPHTLTLVDLQTDFTGKQYVFLQFPWNLFPAWEKAVKYTKRNCNNRRMFCEVGEPLFLIRRLTLQPLIEDTSDKSKTLE